MFETIKEIGPVGALWRWGRFQQMTVKDAKSFLHVGDMEAIGKDN